MPTDPYGLTDSATVASTLEVDLVARASIDMTTTTTADPGTGGTTLAVTSRTFGGRYSVTSGDFYIDVIGTSGISERMLVTAGHGAGAGTFTVTRAQQGTTAVAHSVGAKVAVVVRVERVEPISASKQVSYLGRVSTFRTPGRAGATGQKLMALHNATASPVIVDVDKITVDVIMTAAVAQAPTVQPALVRIWRFTAVPTNGTALTKVAEDTSLATKSSVTAWGDASADSTGSVSALTITLPAGQIITEEFAPRLMVVGTSASTLYEGFDRTTFLEEEGVSLTLRPLEGVCVFLDYTVATANATTNFWLASLRWAEYTNA
jgi:hypothetical protein